MNYRRLFPGIALGLALGFAGPTGAHAVEPPSTPTADSEAEHGRPAVDPANGRSAASADETEVSLEGVGVSDPEHPTTFTPDLQADVFVGENAGPSDVEFSPDGSAAYIVSQNLDEVVVVDVASQSVSRRIPLPAGNQGASRVAISANGERAWVSLFRGYWPTGEVALIDLTAGTTLNTFPASSSASRNLIETLLPVAGGAELLTVGLDCNFSRLDAATGEILEERIIENIGSNCSSSVLTADESRLVAVSGTQAQSTIHTLETETFEILQSTSLVGTGLVSLSSLYIDQSDDRVYFADAAGNAVGIYNPKTGEVTNRVPVGLQMMGTVGVDAENRAFAIATASGWDLVMAADFATGIRSESFRSLPTSGEARMEKSAASGDFAVATPGYNNDYSETFTILNAPRVADPQDVAFVAFGETVRFETDAIGIKRGNGGGIIWQASADGTTWVDIDSALDEQLNVVLDEKNATQLYRVRWHDDFWGRSGTSAPARIVTEAPVITFEGPLPDGAVGTPYPSTEITASGQAELAWSITAGALPDGLRLDATTGTLSGVPGASGTFVFTVTVTDAFGQDSREYELSVVDGGSAPPAPGPDDPPGPADPTDPTDQADPPGAGDPGTPAQPGGSPHDRDLSTTGGASPWMWAFGAVIAVGLGAGLILVRRGRGPSEHLERP